MGLLALPLIGIVVLVTEFVMGKIWKRVGHDVHGYGNGYKAVIYEYTYTDQVSVLISKGDNAVASHVSETLEAGKRWAERHYLKGKDK